MKYRGHIYAIIAAVLWSSIVVIGKLLVQDGLDPLVIVSFRALIAFCLLGGFLFFSNKSLFRINLVDLGWFIGYGFCVALNYASYFYAFQYISGTMAVILLYTYPTLVIIISVFAFKEKINSDKIISLLFTFAGLVLVVEAYNISVLDYSFIGICWGLTAGVAMACYSVLGKKLLKKYNSHTVVWYGFGIGSLFLFMKSWNLINKVSLNIFSYGGIIILAIFPTLLAYALFTRSLLYIEPGRASIICTVEPMTAALLAKIFLYEQINPIQYFGGLLIIVGIIIMEIRQKVSPSALKEHNNKKRLKNHGL